MDHKVALANYLETLPPDTPIEGEIKNKILELLVECWATLAGSRDQSTKADKLYRAENLRWEAPFLSFVLERHAGTVNGSTRAELHYWQVHVVSGDARILRIGHRQLSAMDKRMNTLAVAQETARLIQLKGEHRTLKWIEPGVYVIVIIGEVIPATFKQTTESRRAAYSDKLSVIMRELGWTRSNMGSSMGFRAPESER